MIKISTLSILAAATFVTASSAIASAQTTSTQAAKDQKQRKPTAAQAAAQPSTRGADKFRAGPLYHGSLWLGDDPDPFIRLQIQRDLSHRYGGDD